MIITDAVDDLPGSLPTMTGDSPITDSPALKGRTVGEIMSLGVITARRDETLSAMATLMATHGIHALVVSPLHGGTPLLVSDVELVRSAVTAGPMGQATAGDLAREPAAMLSATATVAEAVEMMAIRYLTHLVATDPGSGDLAGIVSSLDVAAVVAGFERRLERMPRPALARRSRTAPTLATTKVADVMHPGIVACTPDTPVATVARIMVVHRVHCVAVVGIDSAEGRGQHFAWGLIADIDLVIALHRDPPSAAAVRIASGRPPAVAEGDSVQRAAELMLDHDTRHLVTVDGKGLPSGIVSTLDVLSILPTDG